MIKETYNPTIRQFLYTKRGVIDSDQFRALCFMEYCQKVRKINHVTINGVLHTIGYSK